MKFIILGDLHCGVKSGSPTYAKYFNKFFTEVLYPYMLDNGINTIFQLGDVFDSRTNLHYRAYHINKPVWFDMLEEHDFKMHILLGNHDINMKESCAINSPSLLLREYIEFGSVIVHDKPTTVTLDNTTIDIVPWICNENRSEITQFINRKDKADLLLGHLELAGFPMQKGMTPINHGDDMNMFTNYEAVFSGHYHTRSINENIHYVGTPYEITWADCDDMKGFHEFDTETRVIKFIRNPNVMHVKLYYNDGCDIDPSHYYHKNIKLYVQSKSDLMVYDNFIDSIRSIDTFDFTIIESDIGDYSSDQDDSIDITDTITIINNYINGLPGLKIKDKVADYMNKIYMEAASL